VNICEFCGKPTENVVFEDDRYGKSYICESCFSLLKDPEMGGNLIKNALYNSLPDDMNPLIKDLIADNMIELITGKSDK